MVRPVVSPCARLQDDSVACGRNLRAYAKQLAPHLAWLADEIAFVDDWPASQGAHSATVLDAVRQWGVDQLNNTEMTEWRPGSGNAELVFVSRWFDEPFWMIEVEAVGTTAFLRFVR
jgi:hypothetical protein